MNLPVVMDVCLFVLQPYFMLVVSIQLLNFTLFIEYALTFSVYMTV